MFYFLMEEIKRTVVKWKDDYHNGLICLIRDHIIITCLCLRCQGDCALHKFFISFNLILCIIVSVMAVIPKIQEGKKQTNFPRPSAAVKHMDIQDKRSLHSF